MSAKAVRAERVRYDLAFRLLEVKRIEKVTPRMLRVTLGGEQLEGFASASPHDHFKLLFPAEGESEPALPAITDDGIVYPEDRPRPVSRDFTPRRFDAEAGELDVDFVLHGRGTAATWAASATPGSKVGTAGPRGSLVVAPDYDWCLLVGDETSLPSFTRHLEELPEGVHAIVVAEIEDASEEQEAETAASVAYHWVHRNGARPGSVDLVESALRSIEFPSGSSFTWVSGEANTARDVRRYLLNERGFDREYCRFQGHWKQGVANFDHHTPIED